MNNIDPDEYIFTCKHCGIQWSTYPHKANVGVLCGDCVRLKQNMLDSGLSEQWQAAEKRKENKMSKIFLNLACVYKYRNRWVLGHIEGTLDLKSRTFVVNGRKKGTKTFKNHTDVQVFKEQYHTENFIPLQKFLHDRVCFPTKHLPRLTQFHESVNESKYLATLIKNVAGIKEIWVEKSKSKVRSSSPTPRRQGLGEEHFFEPSYKKYNLDNRSHH